MKFDYEYRTKDNVRLSGIVIASSRDEAYAQLKAQGIKPSRMAESPGIFNKLFGKGKRWLAIGLLSVICLGLVVAVAVFRGEVVSAENESHSPMLRHQIYGDPALMESYDRTGYAALFRHEGDRFLARFVQPGQLVTLPSIRDFAMRHKFAESLVESLNISDVEGIVFDPADSREANEIKRIVLWLRGEARRYLANGIGTADRYVNRLEERQIKEFQIYNRIASELKGSKDERLWAMRNETLRALGIRTISRPDAE